MICFLKRNFTLGLVAVFAIGCVPMRTPVSKPMPTKPLKIEGKKAAAPPPAPSPTLTSKDSVLIGIRVDVSDIAITGTTEIQAVDMVASKKEVLPPGIYHLSAANNQLLLNEKPVGTKWKFVSSDPGVFLKCGTKEYRGYFIVRVSNGNKVTVVNELSIDDYLKGVLPREASSSWPDQALRVQAVASRTYLASHLGTHGSQGFDLCSDVHCQVYGGLTNEHPKTNAAVDETRDQILMYENKPISAYFFSHCGGSTEGVQYVWGTGAKPYLPQKKCDFCKGNPRYSWTLVISANEILTTLVKNSNKVKGTELKSIKVRQKSPSGRAQFVSVKTDKGTYDLSGNAFRIAMNPEKIRSTLWTNLQRKGNTYTFSGRGWGHGVGMCQWGAKGQSEQGRDYREILEFYYPHTTLTTWSRT